MADMITIRMDASEIQASLRRLAQNSAHIPAYLVNSTMLRAAEKASKMMPAVTAAEITSELEVASYGVTPKRKLSKAKKPRNTAIESDITSLASRIVLASFYKPNIYSGFGPGKSQGAGTLPGYNVFTGGVFKRPKPATSGTAAFMQWLAESVERMVKARRKSGGFYRLGADVVWAIFRPGVSRIPGIAESAQTGVEAVAGGGNVSKSIGRVAGGVLATGSGPVASASFWVSGTEAGAKGTRGDALFRVAQPVWERALAMQADENYIKAAELYRNAAVASGIDVV